MSATVLFTHCVLTYGVFGYLDWSIACRSEYEAHWVARRWLRSKTRHDKEEIEARAHKDFKRGRAVQRRVAIDRYYSTRYTRGGPPLHRRKEDLCKLVCYRDDGDLEIVLYLNNCTQAIDLGTTWVSESPGNGYRLPDIVSGANRKAFKKMSPPWNGEVVGR